MTADTARRRAEHSSVATPPDGALSHDALVYGSDDEFTAALLPFVRDGLERAEAVVAVTTAHNAALLTDALGAHRGSVEFIDARAWYQAPARTIAGYRVKLDEALGDGARGVRVIGEVAFGDDAASQREWTRYESVLNHVFADAPAWIVCPYDTRRLPPAVVEEAARTHPHLLSGQGRQASRDYLPPGELLRRLRSEMGAPPADAALLTVARVADLSAARSWLRHEGAVAGLTPGRLDEFVTAVGEVLTNGLVHGRPPVRLWIWRAEGTLNVRVADAGDGLHDPLAGFAPPSTDDPPVGGLGLWLVRQLAQTVEILPGRSGTDVHLTVAL